VALISTTATLFKFGKWIDYSKSYRRGEKFPLKGAWSVSLDPFKNLKTPLNISGMDDRLRQVPPQR